MANKTILKWAGSKVRVMEQLRPHLPKTKRLVEPFAGSCAVMMNTDYEQYLIADTNKDLIDLYLVAQSTPIEFIPYAKFYFDLFNENKSYYDIREKFNTTKHMMPQGMSAAFLYLNRHCYNGLCRYSEKTGFNVPFGNYKDPYFPMSEILAFYEKAMNADILHLNYEDTLSLVDFDDGVYCDPPYMTDNGAFTKYQAADFTHDDQIKLAHVLKDINDIQGNPITVSNSICAKELYVDLGFTIYEIDAPRSIAANGNRKSAKEIIAVLEAVQ